MLIANDKKHLREYLSLQSGRREIGYEVVNVNVQVVWARQENSRRRVALGLLSREVSFDRIHYFFVDYAMEDVVKDKERRRP